MKTITKTNIRPLTEKKKGLVSAVNRYAFLSLLAVPIIAGLETYYQNKCYDADTTYILGFWSWVYGISWVIAFSIRRKSLNKFIGYLKATGEDLEESLSFSDDGIEIELKGYFTNHYSWSSLSSVKDTKRHIQFTVAGVEFMCPKNMFSTEEITDIKQLLIEKANQPSQRTD